MNNNRSYFLFFISLYISHILSENNRSDKNGVFMDDDNKNNNETNGPSIIDNIVETVENDTENYDCINELSENSGNVDDYKEGSDGKDRKDENCDMSTHKNCVKIVMDDIKTTDVANNSNKNNTDVNGEDYNNKFVAGKTVKEILMRMNKARGCGECACWYSWWRVSRVRNNCVPPAQPITSLSVSLSCSCECKLNLGKCECYSMKGNVHVDNNCKNGGEPRTVSRFSCGCSCKPSSATCTADLYQPGTLSAWQSNLVTSKKMRDVILPGTHHSGLVTGQTFHAGGSMLLKYVSRIIERWATAQEMRVKNQLENGVRFFDLRLNSDDAKGVLFLAHGKYPKLTRGVLFSSVVKDTVEFLDQNPTEFVVWRLKWEEGTARWDFAQQFLNEYKEYFYQDNPLDMYIGNMRKHIIVCAEGGGLLPFRSRMRCKGSWGRTHSSSGKKLVQNLNDYISADLNVHDNEFNFLEAICTSDVKTITFGILKPDFVNNDYNSLKELSKGCNDLLGQNFLNNPRLMRGNGKNKINAIMMDFINPTYSAVIISLNQVPGLWNWNTPIF